MLCPRPGVRLIREGKAHMAPFIRRSANAQSRRLGEVALPARASSQLLSYLLESSTVSVAMLDRGLHYLASSRRFREEHGLFDLDVCGRHHFELFPETRNDPAWHEVFRRCLAGASEVGETDKTARESTRLDPQTWEILPWYTEHGQVGGLLVSSLASSSAHSAQTSSRPPTSSVQRMEQAVALEGLGLLASGVAHDFNNLLCGMLGGADLSISLLSLSHPASEGLTLVREAAEQAAALSRQLLVYAGRGEREPSQVDVSETVQQMSRLLRAAVTRHIALKFELDAELPRVLAEVSELRQAVLNLVVNAAEAIGRDEGTIWIRSGRFRAEQRDAARVERGARTLGDDSVFLEVTDSGPGVSDEHLQQIFEPFYSTKERGSGLGLATTLRVAERLAGSLRVEGELGRGARFVLVLPSVQGAAIALEPTDEQPPELEHTRGVALVIDDEVSVRTIAARMLESLGFDAIQADRGEAGLKLARAHAGRLKLVLLDVTMPGLRGTDTLRALRGFLPEVPVILCSGYGTSGVAQEISDAHTWFLDKPFRLRGLSQRVGEALQQAQADSR